MRNTTVHTHTTRYARKPKRCLSAIAVLLTALTAGGCVSMDDFAHAVETTNQNRADRAYQYESQPRYYQMVQYSGLCLDVHAPDVRRNGGRVQTWDCTGGANQAFEFVGSSLVTPEGMCLDVNGHERTKNGGRVQVWECNGNINQRWHYSPNNGQLVNAAGLCLDADGHQRGQNGGRVQVWECLNNINQQWFAEAF